MSFNTERRTEAFGAPTPSSQRYRNERVRRANERALRRLKIAEAAATHSGTRLEKREFIETLMKLGHVPIGDLPSLDTISYLARRWESGECKLEDYLDEPRAGRPRAHLKKPLEAKISEAIRMGYATNAMKLTREIETLAETLDLDAPS